MEIVEIDVLDGKGKIPVAVGGYIEAQRLRGFVTQANEMFSCQHYAKLGGNDGMASN